MQKIKDLLLNIQGAKVIEPSISYSEYLPLDLSVFNKNLNSYKLENVADYELFIQSQLDEKKAKIAYGGYLEKRNLYKRSSVFKNETSDERNIHIGLDLWINKQATIHAVQDGLIHSFQNNSALGDYGPTIILEHKINEFKFYTLYGHLSKYKCRAGQRIKRGDVIGYVGSTGRSEAPHLHYEVHKDGKVVNPINFYYGNISAAEYTAISKLANQENQSLD